MSRSFRVLVQRPESEYRMCSVRWVHHDLELSELRNGETRNLDRDRKTAPDDFNGIGSG